MIANVTSLDRRESRPEKAAIAESALERRFMRIAIELIKRWKGPDIDAYLDSLLIDTRGNRMGFPEDVLEEIMFLAGVRWHLEKSAKSESLESQETQESPKDEFSFCTDEFRRCGTTGSWVLV